jgi:hypothetical protein
VILVSRQELRNRVGSQHRERELLYEGEIDSRVRSCRSERVRGLVPEFLRCMIVSPCGRFSGHRKMLEPSPQLPT